jgi:hypothetical protein
MGEQQTGKHLEGREHKHIYGLPLNLAGKIKGKKKERKQKNYLVSCPGFQTGGSSTPNRSTNHRSTTSSKGSCEGKSENKVPYFIATKYSHIVGCLFIHLLLTSLHNFST